MDVCSWDWGAIAGFTGSFVALYISQQWRMQRYTEFKSKMAEKLISIDIEFQNILRKFRVYKTISTPILHEVELVEIKICLDNYLNNLFIFLKLSKEDKHCQHVMEIYNDLNILKNMVNENDIKFIKEFNINNHNYYIDCLIRACSFDSRY